MTLQTLPITDEDGFTDANGDDLKDLLFLGPGNTTLPVFRLRPTLDRVGFQISLVWMQLSRAWLARQLLTRDGAVVTLGIPLTGSGVDLLVPIRSNANVPAGQLWYTFDDGRTGKPLRDDWRGTARLYYRPAELAAQLEGTDRALL